MSVRPVGEMGFRARCSIASDERRVIAIALAWPTCGPQFVSDVLAREGVVMAPVTVWHLLRRHQLGSRRARLALCETYPVSRKIPEFACQLRRRDAAAQQAVTQQLGDPFRILHNPFYAQGLL